MGTSPFHGIFSALGNGDRDELSLPDESTTKRQTQSSRQSARDGVGRVAVDIYEQDDYYIIRAPIAGVRLADLDIEVHENVITIKGTRRLSDVVPEDQYYLQECFFGPFSRSVTLPCVIDPKRVKATFNKESILKVLVPKEEKISIVKIEG